MCFYSSPDETSSMSIEISSFRYLVFWKLIHQGLLKTILNFVEIWQIFQDNKTQFSLFV